MPGIVEAGPIDPKPIAKAVSAGVVERDSGLMDAAPGSLARDEDPRLSVDLKDGTRTQGKSGLTDAAGMYLGKQVLQGTDGHLR
jgi:hypothetical protein